MSNAIPNNLERPLYNEAVYGIKNMNMIQEEMIFMDLLLYLLSKNSGIVLESSFCVISLVLLPSTTHASRDPRIAFPIPIHVDAIPYFHPNCPAYPIKITAEK